jgi:hypothetical protein
MLNTCNKIRYLIVVDDVWTIVVFRGEISRWVSPLDLHTLLYIES